MTNDRDRVVVNFPTTGEEHAKRILAEAQRLANLTPGEWRLWIEGSAERLGISRADLEPLVKEIIGAKERQAHEQKAEERRQEQRREKVAKQQRSDQQREERERQRQQDRADQEAQRKHREKEKEFTKLSKLPAAERDARFAALAKRFGEDPAVLREEFEAFAGGGVTLGDLLTPTTPTTWNVVPWDEPGDVALLLQELTEQVGKYVVIAAHYLTAVVLWVLMDWIHNEIAAHSPILDLLSVDEGSGKTELEGVLSLLTQRSLHGSEFNGPNIYRTVDRDQPTLIMDEMDDAFQRRSDMKHIVNTSWTRSSAKIPRQVRINGELQTHWFNTFCPKIIGHVHVPEKPLPRTIASRGICIRMWPKRPDEHVKEFMHLDDNEFATLRRKLLRFANDQAKAIAEIKPTFPADFNNRVRANWKLLLAIAELAGGDWPERTHKAAEYIAGKTEGSQGARLFTAFHAMCVTLLKEGATEIVISSEEAVEFLKDFDPYWATDYRGSDGHPGEITKNKLAALLRNYEILPQPIHPTKRAEVSLKGYVILEKGKWSEQWLDMFARFAPGLPHIRTLVKPDQSDRKKR
jgi:hypothetical protein